MNSGLVQVYTGEGKGKTTCALGAGLRAAGHGLKVLMISFMKAKIAIRDGDTDINYGEFRSTESIPNFTIIPVGRETFVDKNNPDPIDIEMAQDGLRLAQEAIQDKKCDVLILDEINVAVEWNLLTLNEQLELIRTEMKEVKHYYEGHGVQARKGFEF